MFFSAIARISHLISKMITLQINGADQRVERGSSIQKLLEHLKLVGKKIAVERNGELVPRSDYASCQLSEGDKLEIVVAVGGG